MASSGSGKVLLILMLILKGLTRRLRFNFFYFKGGLVAPPKVTAKQ